MYATPAVRHRNICLIPDHWGTHLCFHRVGSDLRQSSVEKKTSKSSSSCTYPGQYTTKMPIYSLALID